MDAEPDAPSAGSATGGRIEELVFECFERGAGERERALDEACVRHPELAAKLRRRFARLAALGFVDEPEEGSSPDALPPESFGDYRIVRRLGGGGMGVVYLAEQESLGRRVALKLIRPEQLHFGRARERFRREVQAASRLDHPCICTVYEAGEIGGTPYIAMRYLEGETLAERLAGMREREATDPQALTVGLRAAPGHESDSGTTTRADLLAAIWLVERLARAVQVAHAAGLVHRDIKPGNVMVTTAGDPVLLDFGLAQDESVEGQRLTRSGDVLGTPAYMAPEQVAGKGERIDGRADVYALGATLYEFLTLRCPFEALGREELYRQILTSDPVNPRRLNPRVSRDLRAVLERAMEKDPKDRYGTALELAEELRRVRGFEPVRARAVGPLVRAQRWARRHPTTASIMALLLIGLAVSLTLLLAVVDAQRESLALQIAGDSERAFDSEPTLALDLALRSVEQEELPETISAVHRALTAPRQLWEYWVGSPAAVWDLRVSSSGRYLLCAVHDGTARVFDLEDDYGEVRLGEPGDPSNHWDDVQTAVFSPDEEFVLTASHDGFVRLWPRNGGKPVELPHEFSLQSAALHPRKDLILAADYGGGLWLWDFGGELPVWTRAGKLRAHAAPIRARFSPEGERILSFASCWSVRIEFEDYTARLWDLEGEPVGVPMEHEGAILWADYSADGERILTTCNDRSAQLWDSEGRPVGKPMEHESAVTYGAFAADGRFVTGTFDGTVRLWERDGRLPKDFVGHSGMVIDAVFSRADEPLPLLVTAGWDRTARVWTLEGQQLAVLRGAGQGEAIKSVEILPDSWPPRVVTGSRDGRISVWELWDPALPVLAGHRSGIHWADFSPSGEEIATACLDGSIAVWGRDGRRLWYEPQAHASHVSWVEFSPDGELLVSVGQLRDCGKIWRWRDGGEPIAFGQAATMRSATFSPDGDVIVLGTGKGPLLFGTDGKPIDPGDGKFWGKLDVGTPFVITFSPRNGDLLLAFHYDGVLRLWTRSGDLRAEFDGHGSLGSCACFHPDGKSVLTGGRDDRLILWDLEGRPIAGPFYEPGLGIASVDFSPDERHFVSAHRDGSARLWDLEKGLVATLRAHERDLKGAFFTPGGDRILTISGDGTARFWFVYRQELLDHVRSRHGALDRSAGNPGSPASRR